MDLTEAELLLLNAIDNSRKANMFQPAHIHGAAAALIARGLVAEDASGLYVPEEAKLKLAAYGHRLGREAAV